MARVQMFGHFFGAGGGGAGAILFLHERVSLAGHRRLVCIGYAAEIDSFQPRFIEGYNYDSCVASPATWIKPFAPVKKGYELDVMSGFPRRPPLVRAFAGQPDANDPAHFTIRYQMWGQEDVLDGRLQDNDHITLTPRHRPQWSGD